MPACFCRGWCSPARLKLSQLAECLSLLWSYFLQERYQGSVLRPGSLPEWFSFFNWNRSLLRIQEILEDCGSTWVTGTMIRESESESELLWCFAMDLSWDALSQLAAQDFGQTDSWEIYWRSWSKSQRESPSPATFVILSSLLQSPHFKPHRMVANLSINKSFCHSLSIYHTECPA